MEPDMLALLQNLSYNGPEVSGDISIYRLKDHLKHFLALRFGHKQPPYVDRTY